VAFVMAVVVFGGYAAAAMLSVPAGPPLSVGGLVAVQPLSGWRVASSGTVGGFPVGRITRGSGTLDVVVVPGVGGDPRTLAGAYAGRVLGQQLSHLSASSALTDVSVGGQPGVRFHYVGVTDAGASIEGEVTAVVTPSGDGVVFDGWAPEGLLGFVDGALHTMIDRARFA